MKIIYIVGYGRSGSTLLDRLLGNREGVVSCGEIAFFFRVKDRSNHHCSCGKALTNCELWSFVCSHTFNSANRDLELMSVLENRVGSEAIIVDSSKTAYGQMRRPLKLLAAGYEVVPILIWRHPADVIRSRSAAQIRSGKAKFNNQVSLYQALSGSIGWLLSNIAGIWVVLRAKGAIVSFTDLVRNPDDVSDQLVNRLCGPIQSADIKGNHLALGNRMRNLDTDKGPLDTQRPSLDGFTRVFVLIFCQPLLFLLKRFSGSKS